MNGTVEEPSINGEEDISHFSFSDFRGDFMSEMLCFCEDYDSRSQSIESMATQQRLISELLKTTTNNETLLINSF